MVSLRVAPASILRIAWKYEAESVEEAVYNVQCPIHNDAASLMLGTSPHFRRYV